MVIWFADKNHEIQEEFLFRPVQTHTGQGGVRKQFYFANPA